MGTELMTEEESAKTAAAIANRKALHSDGGGVMPVIPRDAHQATIYAMAMVKANQVPRAYQNGGQANAPLVAAGILKGLEIGLPPQTALGFLMPINGQFTVWGDGAQALIQKEDLIADYLVEWVGKEPDETTPREKWPGSYGVRVSIWRKGVKRPYVGEFTVADARAANLWGKAGPWKLYPKRMLFNRARAFAQRDGFADCLAGLHIFEERRDVFGDPGDQPQLVDNSALDDDFTAADTTPIAEQDLEGAVEKHITGLAMIGDLEALQDYQTTPEATALSKQLGALEDESLFVQFTAANAKRFQEIDEANQKAEKEAAEAEKIEGEEEIEEVEAEVVEEGDQGDLLDGEKGE